MTNIQSICVYCGSSDGNDEVYIKSAQLLGRIMAKANIRLVYGGGSRGIMGAISKAVRDSNGQITGIIPRFLIEKESSEKDVTGFDEIVVTETMHQRKHLMFEASDAFIVLPGGIGTLEEIVEIMTWAQLGHHTKPMVFANINGFWDPLLHLFKHMSKEGFIHTEDKVRPLVIDDVAKIIDSILAEAEQVDLQHGETDKF